MINNINYNHIIEITPSLLDKLKVNALNDERRRVRFCLHDDPSMPVNEMLLVMCKDSYIRPHRHPENKSESYHMIDGEMDVIFFNTQGREVHRIEMGILGCGKTFSYRLSAQFWHAPVPRTDTVAYIEVYSGPFDKDIDVEYAPWAKPEAYHEK